VENKLKIVHVYKDFDVYNGLIETFFHLLRHVDRSKCDLSFCVFNKPSSEFYNNFLDQGGLVDHLDFRWNSNPLIIFRLAQYFRKVRPHIVQSYVLKPNIFCVLAAKIARVPVIITTELTLKDQAPSTIRRLRDKLLYPVNGFFNRYSDAIVSASKIIKSQHQSKISKSKHKVIYPPFDMSMLSEQCVCERVDYKKNDNSYVIGIVGRLSEEKRHIDLIRAFSLVTDEYPRSRLIIVGDGPLKSRLLDEVSKLGLSKNVDFKGFQSDVSPYYKEMDIFVLPSRTEGFGIVLLEAMAYGLPVIAANKGGIREIVVNDENGLLMETSDRVALASAIKSLIKSPEKRRELGENARKLAEGKFHPQKYIDEHENLYELLLKAKGYS